MMEKHGIQNHCSFTGKERDEETGFGYFGARYMDHELMTMWLSVDPLADKYPSISPYAYCAWNPVKLVDPDGRDTLNLAASKFLRKQKDISNALIINGHGKSRPPLKELWDSIANVAEKVADVAVAVWADITSGETVVYYDDLDNEVGRSTTWYLDKAVEASVKAYNDRQH
jgi:RHS repeat-associated protein